MRFLNGSLQGNVSAKQPSAHEVAFLIDLEQINISLKTTACSTSYDASFYRQKSGTGTYLRYDRTNLQFLQRRVPISWKRERYTATIFGFQKK